MGRWPSCGKAAGSGGIEAVADEHLARLCALYKDRCATTVELADWIGMYYVDVHPSADELAAHVIDAVKPAVVSLRGRLAEVAWDKAAISAAIKATLAEHGLKMPQLAHAVVCWCAAAARRRRSTPCWSCSRANRCCGLRSL